MYAEKSTEIHLGKPEFYVVFIAAREKRKPPHITT